MNLAKLVRAVAIAATFLTLPLAAQTESVFTDDFQSYGTQKNPPGWVDTSIGSSKPEAGGLYKTWPDPTQGSKATNVVFGSKSASGKPEANNNPRIGHFSTYSTKTFAGSGRFEFTGRFPGSAAPGVGARAELAGRGTLEVQTVDGAPYGGLDVVDLLGLRTQARGECPHAGRITDDRRKSKVVAHRIARRPGGIRAVTESGFSEGSSPTNRPG